MRWPYIGNHADDEAARAATEQGRQLGRQTVTFEDWARSVADDIRAVVERRIAEETETGE